MTEKIAHITDLHLDEIFPFENCHTARKRFDAILEDIDGRNITQIVCTGDIGESKGLQYFFEQLKDKKLTITLGNHDSDVEISKYYNTGSAYNSKRNYRSALKKYYKFIYLDSSEGIIGNEQLVWLQKELISPKPIIVFIHHPIVGLNLKVDEIGKLKNRKKVIAILTKSVHEIVIYCGHYHMESVLVHKNITQYITPAVGYQIKKDPNKIEIDTKTSGYRIIQIDNEILFSKIQLFHNAI